MPENQETLTDYGPSTVLCLKMAEDRVVHLHHDVRRSYLYHFDPRGPVFLNEQIVHPVIAVTLALFDGSNTISQVQEKVQNLFEIAPEAASNRVNNLLNCFSRHLGPVNGSPPNVYDPLSFVVPVDQVDMTTVRRYRPISVLLRITDDCMRRCIYCNAQKRKTSELRLLPLGRLEELLDECRDIGVLDVTMGGGDPFMRPDTVKIIGAAIKRGFHPFVTTKAFIPERTAREIADTGLSWMQYSMDSPDPATADRLTGSLGFFRQAVESIRNLVGAGLNIRINSIITSLNVRQGPDLVRLLTSLGVRKIKLSPMGVSMHAAETESLLPSYEDCKWLKANAPRSTPDCEVIVSTTDPPLADQEAKRAAYKKRSSCSAGYRGIVIHSDGKVTLCDELPLEYAVGDVSKQSIMDVWNSQAVTDAIYPPRERFRGTACFDCEEFDECHRGLGRCFRESLKAYGSYYAPPPNCPRAPDARRLN